MNNTTDILNYIWSKSGSLKLMKSVSGNTIDVVSSGTPHEEDKTLYYNAQLYIDGVLTKGCVKIVENANAWILWNSPFKGSVIVVVTSDCNEPIVSITNSSLNVIKPEIPAELKNRYHEFKYYKEQICGELLNSYDPIERERLWACLMIERIEFKCKNIASLYKETDMSWSDTALFMLFDTIDISNKRNRELYKKLFRNIGYGSIIRNIVTKSSSQENREENLKNVEALLFGTSGLLSKLKYENIIPDSYTYELRERFDIIKSRYSINVINPELWSYGSAGKGNLLPLQLARLAAIIVTNPTLHYDIISAENLEKLRNIFSSQVNKYWSNHIGLSREDVPCDKRFTKPKIDIFIINFIVPYLFLYNETNSESYNDTMCDTLLSYMIRTDAERNMLTNRWRSYVDINNAFVGQALIHLSKLYCDNNDCLKCSIAQKQLSKIKLF